MQISAHNMATRFSGEILGDPNEATRGRTITGMQSITDATADDLAFAADASSLAYLSQCNAGIVLLAKADQNRIPEEAAFTAILVSDPMDCFLELLTEFRPEKRCSQVGISHKANIDSTVKMGSDCHVFPGVTIEANVTIGARCTLYPGVYIGHDCVLGDDVTIAANAVLHSDVSIGNRVQVFAGAVLGSDGFGFRMKSGQLEKIPHRGQVRIEDDVEIGAGAMVDRAMIGTTVIGQGTKLDNLVMVGHNCQIGQHNVVASQVGLAGSSQTGDYTRIGGQAGIADHVIVGAGCSVAAKAGVHRNIPDGETQMGAPASPASEQRRILMSLRRLPDIKKKVAELQKEMEQLHAQMEQMQTGQQAKRSAA